MQTGAKNFRKRNAILAYLQQTTAHPSAEMIFTDLKPQIPDLSMGTVYRNLTLFKQQGLVSSVATVSGVERFDGNIKPHVHFVCTDCGRITDLHQMQIPGELSETAAKLAGARVTQCQITFQGQCGACGELC